MTLNVEDGTNYLNMLREKMIFLSTPFSREAADRLIKFGVKAFKIGSGNEQFPLLEHISRYKKTLIVSTGMHNLKVLKTYNFLKKNLLNLH